MNNLPAALVARSAVETLGGHPALVYATLVGTNVGPNVVPFGSLATVLVLALARERGVRVSAWSFARAGLWTTPFVCVLASLAIALTTR
jgi:arsenical pump membrane protein